MYVCTFDRRIAADLALFIVAVESSASSLAQVL